MQSQIPNPDRIARWHATHPEGAVVEGDRRRLPPKAGGRYAHLPWRTVSMSSPRSTATRRYLKTTYSPTRPMSRLSILPRPLSRHSALRRARCARISGRKRPASPQIEEHWPSTIYLKYDCRGVRRHSAHTSHQICAGCRPGSATDTMPQSNSKDATTAPVPRPPVASGCNALQPILLCESPTVLRDPRPAAH